MPTPVGRAETTLVERPLMRYFDQALLLYPGDGGAL
jgi:hypothetical protein